MFKVHYVISCDNHHQSIARQGPHLTSKKSDGRTKGLKRAFLTSRAIFSAKNGRKLKNGTFLESAVREFSENGFGSKINYSPGPYTLKQHVLRSGEVLTSPYLSLFSLGFVLDRICISDF